MKKNIMKRLFSIGLLVVLSACGGNKFNVAINENIESEYGEELNVDILFDKEKSDKDITVKDVKDFDPKKIGEQEITVTFALGDETQDQKVKVNVKDTQAPEIIFKSETVEITLGDEIDTTSNIESVKDPVDGDIKQSTDNTITKDGYFITSDIKTEAGEYTVTVTAFDVNGNKAEKSYNLVIKEKSQETASTSQAQQNAPTQSGSQAPSQSSSSGSNASSGSQPAPSQPKVVCPNGNEPENPNLPCNAIVAGYPDDAYKDASGNLVLFDTPEAAYDWAKNAWRNGEIEGDYSSYATASLGRNDGTQCYGIYFFK